MKRLLRIVFLILFIVFIKLVLGFIINEYIVLNYNNGNYNNILIKSLYVFNFNEKYIVYYNDGNISYKNHNYERAINQYEKSLSYNPPMGKICDIRVNLSLAIIANIDSDINKEYVIEQLNFAKNNLYENSCINYNNKAKQLEKEIDDWINNLSDKDNGNSDGDDSYYDNVIDENKYEKIEKEILENKKNANSSRQDDLNMYDYINGYEYSNSSGKNW